jgi:hypothetical protein
VGQDVTPPAAAASGSVVDVSDRAARLLGQVSVPAGVAIVGTIDIADRAGRLVGQVSVPAGVDVTDRAGRALGVVASITAGVDVTDRAGRALGAVSVPAGVDTTDRAGRLLGVVASITAAVDVSDRAGRLVGVVDTELPAAAALADGAANPTTPTVGVDPSVFGATASQWSRWLGDAGVGLVRHRAPSAWAAGGAGGVNAIATATAAAAGAGTFIYITHIRIVRVATAALAGGAILAITTTNLTGAPGWRVGNAMVAGGTQIDMDIEFVHPIKAAVANTAVTIVGAAPGAAVSWDIQFSYFASSESK